MGPKQIVRSKEMWVLCRCPYNDNEKCWCNFHILGRSVRESIWLSKQNTTFICEVKTLLWCSELALPFSRSDFLPVGLRSFLYSTHLEELLKLWGRVTHDTWWVLSGWAETIVQHIKRGLIETSKTSIILSWLTRADSQYVRVQGAAIWTGNSKRIKVPVETVRKETKRNIFLWKHI